MMYHSYELTICIRIIIHNIDIITQDVTPNSKAKMVGPP